MHRFLALICAALTRRAPVALAICALAAANVLPIATAQEPSTDETSAQQGTDAGDAAEVEALIRVLEDDEARARLIERLRVASADSPTQDAAAGPAFARRLAEYTRDVVESGLGFFTATTALVGRLSEVTNGAAEIDLQALWRVVLGVALLVAATFAVYLALQLAFWRLQRSLAASAAGGDALKRAKMIGSSALLDLGTVAVAWVVGYVFALNIGEARRIGLDQSLFLNAFLIIELVKAGSRTVLAPRWGALRPMRMDDTSAAYWYFWLSRLVSLVGYTFLFAAPIVSTGVSADAAEALRIVVLFTALAIAAAIILQNREAVRLRLSRRAELGRTDPVSRTLATVARVWHIAAIGYLIVVFALWISDPGTALPFVLTATAESIAAILIGTALTAFIARFASGGMRLPADVKARLPLLEARLNAFVPGVLRVVRTIVGVAVAVTILQAWQLVDVIGWLSSETGERVLTSLISSALILLIGGVVYLVMQSWIEYRLNPNLGRAVTARERTLLGLFRNGFTILLGVLVVMLVLSELGVNIAPLIAGAGVVGLAIGFGAQKLVQDIINGAFIQFENTMNEGDVVNLGGVSGAVERLTIRSVSLRSLDGAYHVIPFSSVDTVSNLTKHFGYHVAAIGVAYRESIPEVKEAMQEAFDRLKRSEAGADILGDFEMQGIVEFADSAVVVRGRIKTVPGKQWGIGRTYNELVKQIFDERGIEIPFPHVTVYLGEDKAGEAPPLRIRDADSSPARA